VVYITRRSSDPCLAPSAVELGRIAVFRPDRLPKGLTLEAVPRAPGPLA
jgi:hypothetical protein